MPTSRLPPDIDALWQRYRQHFWLKTIGITAFISVFFIGYFQVLKFPQFPVTVMPLTVLDHWIGVTALALPLYISLWVYVPLAPALAPGKRELYDYGWEAGGVSLAGLAIFFFWPTTLPIIDIDWTQHRGLEFLKTVDASGNACPSLHVAFAVFTAIRLHEIFLVTHARAGLHIVNWLWCLGIVYSTLATKQHVAVDALAGALLGMAGGRLHWTRWLRKDHARHSQPAS